MIFGLPVSVAEEAALAGEDGCGTWGGAGCPVGTCQVSEGTASPPGLAALLHNRLLISNMPVYCGNKLGMKYLDAFAFRYVAL